MSVSEYRQQKYLECLNMVENSNSCGYQLSLELSKQNPNFYIYIGCSDKCKVIRDTYECYNKRLHYFNPNIDIYNYDECSSLKGYISNSTKIKLICHKCGHIWETTWKSARMGQFKCKCKMSKYEMFIASLLDELGVDYEYDKRIKNPSMRFDFLINGKYAIEYDGIQHYKPSSLFGDDEFNKTQIRDAIKNEYCNINSIILLRIPYTLKNYEIKNTILEFLHLYHII